MKFFTLIAVVATFNVFAVTQDNPYEVKNLSLFRETDNGLVKVNDLSVQDKDLKTKVVRSTNPKKLSALALDNQLPGVDPDGKADPFQKVGDVIAIADKIIALGEKVYELVNKGRPNTEFNYAPISVIPKTDKDNGADVLMDMSGGSMPAVENFHIIAKNGFDKTVIDFEFTLMFFHSLSYNGMGKFITAAQIIPKNIVVKWGFDFSATMKLNGIVNHGSSENPVAGAIMVLEYDIKNALQYTKKSAIFHIMGDGQIFNY